MELLLKKNELMSMGKHLKGCTIICTKGRCWLTLENNGTDYILAQGKELKVASNGHLVVTATEDCRIKVILPGQVVRTSWSNKILPKGSFLRFS